MSVNNLIVLYVILLSTSAKAEISDVGKINVNDIQLQLPAELANANLTLDNIKKLFKDKCIKVAGKEKGEEAIKEIEMATLNLGECITNIVNYTAIQKEIEEASPLGELDIVFSKYCKKRPDALECVEIFNTKLVPCLEKEEQENQDVFMRIVRSLLNFVCHKGGDQIALFIAEKGPECLESKKEDIQHCINNTFSRYVPKDGIENVKTLPKFIMSPKHCSDMEKLETCVVEKLELCQEITPANIVESMFRFIKNETICRTNPSSATTKDARTSTAATFGMSFIPSVTFCFIGFRLAFSYFGKWI